MLDWLLSGKPSPWGFSLAEQTFQKKNHKCFKDSWWMCTYLRFLSPVKFATAVITVSSPWADVGPELSMALEQLSCPKQLSSLRKVQHAWGTQGSNICLSCGGEKLVLNLDDLFRLCKREYRVIYLVLQLSMCSLLPVWVRFLLGSCFSPWTYIRPSEKCSCGFNKSSHQSEIHEERPKPPGLFPLDSSPNDPNLPRNTE